MNTPAWLSRFIPEDFPKEKRAEISLRGEILGGITTFLTMAYIVVVNPAILSTEGTGMPFSGVMTATVVLSALLTFMMGTYARLPYAVAPGMGLNAFFTFSIVLGHGVPWPVALGVVVWSGVLFLAASLTPLRESLAHAIPSDLRHAAAVGIGIFLTFIGLKNAGWIGADAATFVTWKHFTLETTLSALGLVMAVVWMRKKKPWAFLAVIAGLTALGWAAGRVHAPSEWISRPDFTSVWFKMDLMGALKLSLLPTILAICFTDLFDSLSTFVGVSNAAGLVNKKGEPVRLKEGLVVDAFATLGAGLVGTSSGTAYIESAAGIESGARTGFASVITALCFIPCLFLAPVAGMVPAFATAPVLIVVGALMFRSIRSVQWGTLEDTVPAFLTIVLIPLTFSITQGMLWGFALHVVLYAFVGRAREISRAMWGVGGLSIALLVLEQWY